MNNSHIISFDVAFPRNFNREFYKYNSGIVQEEFLPLGIWQFYPANITVTDDAMSIKYDDFTLVLGKYKTADYHDYFSKHVNKGAMI